MTKLNLYTAKGIKKNAGINLPKQYQERENLPLLAQAIRVYEDNLHFGLSKTKTRGEISLTKRKAYRQKGTGMARHGAKSAPIFVGGSKAHGPKGLKRTLSLPKKMKRKALKVALSIKARGGKAVVVSNISSLKKTKEAASLINKIAKSEKDIKDNSRFTFVLSDKNKDATFALRNIKNVKTVFFKNLNAHDVYFGGVLVIDSEAFEENRLAKSSGVSGKGESKKKAGVKESMKSAKKSA